MKYKLHGFAIEIEIFISLDGSAHNFEPENKDGWERNLLKMLILINLGLTQIYKSWFGF